MKYGKGKQEEKTRAGGCQKKSGFEDCKNILR